MILTLLPYHQRTSAHLKQLSGVWNFFSGHKLKEEQLIQFKTDLLKNTYKFDEQTDTSLYEKLNAAKQKLNLDIPVFLYQAQNAEEMNASIVFLNNEAHIVFSGPILQLLNEQEQLAIIAHELSHVQLYYQLEGEAEVADRIISAIANHSGSTPAHYETARLFKLYTEIFCDRGAYIVTGEYGAVISSLVKIATGLQSVNADSFIKQAEEIFSTDTQTKTTGISHPENFIRARAVWLWHTMGHAADPLIEKMLEGNTNIDELDLFRQLQLTEISKKLIQLLLEPAWMQTATTISLGKQYFGNLEPGEVVDRNQLAEKTDNLQPNLQDYFAYVLYDFATADKTLEDVPLGYSFFLADELKLDKAFTNAVKKERKLTDKKTATLKKQALASFHSLNIPTA